MPFLRYSFFYVILLLNPMHTPQTEYSSLTYELELNLKMQT